MMTNKVLVTISVPSLEKSFDIFIPVNKKIHSVIKMIKKSLFEISIGTFNFDKEYALYNAENGQIYDMNLLIRNTDIRNDSRIVLL